MNDEPRGSAESAQSADTAIDEQVRRALSRGNVIDITTTGGRTGKPRRIEIVYHNIGGRIYISGMPSRRVRSWIRNLERNPNLMFHLKRGVRADLPATARVIADPDERRSVLEHIARNWGRTDVDVMVRYSPLIEVTIRGYSETVESSASNGS